METAALAPAMTGKITRVVISKGFGFIAGDDKRDYFFHMTSVDPASIAFRHMKEGTTVAFTIHPPVSPGKNLQAKDVTLVNVVTVPMVSASSSSA